LLRARSNEQPSFRQPDNVFAKAWRLLCANPEARVAPAAASMGRRLKRVRRWED
jgi:hypothetical protein